MVTYSRTACAMKNSMNKNPRRKQRGIFILPPLFRTLRSVALRALSLGVTILMPNLRFVLLRPTRKPALRRFKGSERRSPFKTPSAKNPRQGSGYERITQLLAISTLCVIVLITPTLGMTDTHFSPTHIKQLAAIMHYGNEKTHALAAPLFFSNTTVFNRYLIIAILTMVGYIVCFFFKNKPLASTPWKNRTLPKALTADLSRLLLLRRFDRQTWMTALIQLLEKQAITLDDSIYPMRLKKRRTNQALQDNERWLLAKLFQSQNDIALSTENQKQLRKIKTHYGRYLLLTAYKTLLKKQTLLWLSGVLASTLMLVGGIITQYTMDTLNIQVITLASSQLIGYFAGVLLSLRLVQYFFRHTKQIAHQESSVLRFGIWLLLQLFLISIVFGWSIPFIQAAPSSTLYLFTLLTLLYPLLAKQALFYTATGKQYRQLACDYRSFLLTQNQTLSTQKPSLDFNKNTIPLAYYCAFNIPHPTIHHIRQCISAGL